MTSTTGFIVQTCDTVLCWIVQGFETANGIHDTAIFFSTSNKSGTYVTTATVITREAEPDLLQDLFRYPNKIGPFEQADYLYPRRDDQKFKEILTSTVSHSERILAAQRSFEPNANPNEEEIKAIQAALLAEELLLRESEPLLIYPGNRSQTKEFVQALDGLTGADPAVDHCIRCREYYPACLALNLIARYLAYWGGDENFQSKCEGITVRRYDQTAESRWGNAAKSRRESTASYEPRCIRSVHREQPRERVYCWYIGGVAHGDEDEITIRFEDLMQWCVGRYPNLAAQFRSFRE